MAVVVRKRVYRLEAETMKGRAWQETTVSVMELERARFDLVAEVERVTKQRLNDWVKSQGVVPLHYYPGEWRDIYEEVADAP